MLKLTYTEAGLHMERLATSLEVVVAQRMILALRCGRKFYIEPGHASFLLAADVPDVKQLEKAVRHDANRVIAVTPVDDQCVEISLSGSWMAESAEALEGMFLTMMSDRTEFFVYKLWQTSQSQVSSRV